MPLEYTVELGSPRPNRSMFQGLINHGMFVFLSLGTVLLWYLAEMRNPTTPPWYTRHRKGDPRSPLRGVCLPEEGCSPVFPIQGDLSRYAILVGYFTQRIHFGPQGGIKSHTHNNTNITHISIVHIGKRSKDNQQWSIVDTS